MSKKVIGSNLQIQCYKHDGKVHRCWSEAIILDVKKDYIVCGNNRTLVIESSGSIWRTKEPAILYFFKDRWFNIIAQLKNDGISYYCNIATPFIIEDNTIKYIDYDLDLRIFSSGEYRILDRMEYKYHKFLMEYPDDLDKAVKNGLNDLIHFYKKNKVIFNKQNNIYYNKMYQNLKKSKKREKSVDKRKSI